MRSRSKERLLWEFILVVGIVVAFLFVVSDEEKILVGTKATLELA